MTAVTELPRWTYVGAYALATDEQQRVLLVRVAPGYATTGMWTLPGGGLEFGESPDAAAVRELYEETGLDGKADSLAFVSSQTGPPGQERGRPYGPYHAIRIVYRIAIMGGELAHETNGSTDGARWFTRSDASQLPLVALAQAGLDHLGGE